MQESVLLTNLIGELLDLIVDVTLFPHQFMYLCSRVHNSGVISPTEGITDLRQREISEISRQIHSHLPRIDDVLGPLASYEISMR